MKKYLQARVILHSAARRTIEADVCRRAKIEACGVLLGKIDQDGNWWVEAAHPLKNTYASPVYFEFDPEELLTVDLSYPGQVVGVYHSHPTGFATASGTDRQNMERVNQQQEIPWVWLIVRGPFTKASGEISLDRIIAYHHYEQEGLQHVTIEFGQESRMTQDDAPSSSITG